MSKVVNFVKHVAGHEFTMAARLRLKSGDGDCCIRFENFNGETMDYSLCSSFLDTILGTGEALEEGECVLYEDDESQYAIEITIAFLGRSRVVYEVEEF